MRIKKTIIEVILTLIIISGINISYALLSDLKVNSSDTLTASLWNSLIDHSVPSGSVVSFDLETCPTGWTEYTQLRGRFIRGADTGANNDPDFASRTGGTGTRKIGSIQDDQLQNHNHTYIRSNGRIEAYTIGANGNPFYYDYSDTTGTTGGNETRPKNVYLLYCIKS